MAYWRSLEKTLLVWKMLNEGLSARQVARRTGVNQNTIGSFRRRLFERAAERKRKGLGEKANN